MIIEHPSLVDERTATAGELDFHPLISQWFINKFGRPTEAAAAGLAGDRRGPQYAHRRSDRLGQDAGGVSVLHRSPVPAGDRRRAGRSDRSRLRLAAEGPLERHPPQPAGAAGGDPARWRQPPVMRRRRFARRSAPATRRAAERQRMLRRPPHILVTTPESLVSAAHQRPRPRDAAHRANGDRR